MDIGIWKQQLDLTGDKGKYSNYSVESEPFAEGVNSKVYRCTRDGFTFAIKMPVTVPEDESETGRRFAEMKFEIERWDLLSRLFPNDAICIFDYGFDPFPWSVMELADRSLAMAIAEGTATVDDIIQILESLQNLHSIRVSHLDIKPENILGVNGRWKFADFGSIVTGSSGAVVTPRYRAPEQLQNKPADQRADIWHIGLILYRLLAGHIPFISGNPEEILERIQSENIDLSCIPLEYQPVILKALAVNPDRRFQSAQEFKEALMKVNMTASDNVPAEPQYPDHIAQAIDFCLGKERFDVFAAYALVKDGEDPLAQMMAAVFEFNGKGTDMDVLSAIGRMESNLSALFKLAQSDPLAQFLLGEMYLRGIYLDENDKLGFELIRRSASRNFPLALCEFGTCYEEGCGVEVDHMKALINYSKSSEMGCIEALHRLGRIFETGNEYVQRDHQKAIDIFDECIDRGYYMAFYDLAATCVNGLDDLIDEPLFRKYGLMYLEKVGQHDSLVIFDDDSPLYAGNDRVEFVIVKDGVKVIPDEAFKNCTNLSCVSLGSTVETIGADAFSGTTVRTLNVPSSVRDIRPNAFKISTLTELKLHNGLVNIGTDAFFGNSLERLTIPQTVKTIGDMAFYSSTLERVIYLSTIGSFENSFRNYGKNLKVQQRLESVEAIAMCPAEWFDVSDFQAFLAEVESSDGERQYGVANCYRGAVNDFGVMKQHGGEFENSIYIDKARTRAFYFYQLSSNNRHPDATFELALCYLMGIGCERSVDEFHEKLEFAKECGCKLKERIYEFKCGQKGFYKPVDLEGAKKAIGDDLIVLNADKDRQNASDNASIGMELLSAITSDDAPHSNNLLFLRDEEVFLAYVNETNIPYVDVMVDGTTIKRKIPQKYPTQIKVHRGTHVFQIIDSETFSVIASDRLKVIIGASIHTVNGLLRGPTSIRTTKHYKCDQ